MQIFRRFRGWALLGVLLWSHAPGYAEDLDDILSGFNEEDPSFDLAPATSGESAPRRRWDLSGSLEISGSINTRSHRSDTGTDYGGLQRLRNRLNLQVDADLPRQWALRMEAWAFYDGAYRLNGRGDYSREVLNQYEADADLGEAWISWTPQPRIDIKIGRQVVVWGRSETLRVADMINPLDNREPGRVDLEDVRRPLGMLRLDAYSESWSLTALAIPEFRFDLGPVLGSDFYPGDEVFDEIEPKNFEQVEVAAALTGIFHGWDISFYTAQYWSDEPRFQREQGGLVLVHDRLRLLASSGAVALGSWLVKYEAAHRSNIGFLNGSDKERIDVLLGVEYYGFADTTIVFEAVNRRLLNYRQALFDGPDFSRKNTEEVALRVTRSFLNDRVQATALGILLGGGEDGSIARFDVDYDLLDGLEVGVGMLFYDGGERQPLSEWGQNDRLIFNIKWSF